MSKTGPDDSDIIFEPLEDYNDRLTAAILFILKAAASHPGEHP